MVSTVKNLLFILFILAITDFVASINLFNWLRSTRSNYNSVYNTDAPIESLLSTRQLVEHQSHNYTLEEHNVTTSDGYILTLFKVTPLHIPQNQNQTKEPVLILSGFWCSSDDWFLTKPAHHNLPYLLAERGHSVWLGNFRGNRYSTSHINLTSDDLKFWDFTYDEMGDYDVPALINYILDKTQQDSLSYIGYSMGCTAFFVAMDKHSELQSKVRKMIALAPGAYVSHSKTFLVSLFRSIPPDTLLRAFHSISRGPVIPKRTSRYLHKNLPLLCAQPWMSQMCFQLMSLVVGFDAAQMTKETSSLAGGHLFSPISAKTVVHFMQVAKSGQFRQFDYGYSGNLKFYNSSSPPTYRLDRIQVPIKLMYGLNDWLIDPKDALRTVRELGNVVQASPVNFTEWNHLDFIYGRDAKSLVYDDCVQFLDN